MEVPGLGAHPTGADLASTLRGVAAPQGRLLAALQGVTQSSDTIAAILGQLSDPAAMRLLEVLDHSLSPENAVRLDTLLRASVSAVAEGNVQQALLNLAEFAALDPRRAETLPSDPGLASIRREVGALLSRLASAAHLDAESQFGQATQRLEAELPGKVPARQATSEIAILIAGRLLEAGGYANYTRSAALSRMAIGGYDTASPAVPASLTAILRQLPEPVAANLLELIQRPPSPETAARLSNLLRAAFSAAAEGNVQQALAKLTEFVVLDPRRAEALASEPGLTPIRREIAALLSVLASAARPEAEAQLTQASQLLEFLQRPPSAENAPRLEKLPLFTGLIGLAAVLASLPEPMAAQLLAFLQRPSSAENTVRLDNLLRASVADADVGNVRQALDRLTEFATLDPRRAETLVTEPGLASIRKEIDVLLSRLESNAHLDAGARLRQASQLLTTEGSREAPGQIFRPETAILIAGRLLDAGGYANCMLSAELSQFAINSYGFAATSALRPSADRRSVSIPSIPVSAGAWRQWLSRIGRLWRRAPLLILLLAWFVIGLVSGSVLAMLRILSPEAWPESVTAPAFEVWAIGFLVLIGFGFYATVRNWRRR